MNNKIRNMTAPELNEKSVNAVIGRAAVPGPTSRVYPVC